MGTWTLDSINWDRFDASKVDPEILRNIKAAAMVERNGSDYGIYLGRVFANDPAFVEDVQRWSGEEIQHGMALGRWAQLADPAWDFDAAFEFGLSTIIAGLERVAAGQDHDLDAAGG